MNIGQKMDSNSLTPSFRSLEFLNFDTNQLCWKHPCESTTYFPCKYLEGKHIQLMLHAVS